jgi:hypothetical protein
MVKADMESCVRYFVTAVALVLAGLTSQGTSGWSTAAGLVPQDYQELETVADYFQESLSPILVDLTENPVQDPSRAAKYKELSENQKRQITTNNRNARNLITEDRRKVQAVLEGAGDLSDPLIAKYFGGYVFPEMTRFENLPQLGTARSDFLKFYLSNRVSGPVRTRFIEEVCLPNLKKIYANEEQNLHPSARLSAVYLLGLLDSAAASRSGATPPVPSPAALDELMRLADGSDELLKTGAWTGLHRHLQIDAASGGGQIPNQKKLAIRESANRLIRQTAEQNQLTAEVDYWLKRRSIQSLGFLRSADSLEVITDVLKNPDQPFWLRYDALEALGLLQLGRVDQETVNAIGRFLIDGLEAEARAIDEEVANLIYTNMLFQDLDLEKEGVNWEAGLSAPGSGSRAGGPPGGSRGGNRGGGVGGVGVDGGGAGMAGGGAGTAGPDGDGDRGQGARGGARGGGLGAGLGAGPGATGQIATDEPKKIELPNYLLQVSRRKIKSLAFTGKQILMPRGSGETSNNGLMPLAENEDTRNLIRDLANELDKVVKDSEVGIINLDARPATRRRGGDDDEVSKEAEETTTIKLTKVCQNAANKMRELLGINEPPAEAAAVPAADGSPD